VASFRNTFPPATVQDRTGKGGVVLTITTRQAD